MILRYQGTDGKSYTEMKEKANRALTTVGRSWSWKSNVYAGSPALASHMEEIMTAIDYAYDGVASGCNSRNSSDDGDRWSDYSDNSSRRSSNYSTNDSYSPASYGRNSSYYSGVTWPCSVH